MSVSPDILKNFPATYFSRIIANWISWLDIKSYSPKSRKKGYVI